VESEDRWWGTTGLRICAVLLWVLAAWFGRLVWLRRKRLERTVAVVEVSVLEYSAGGGHG
jgi:tetraacyldisaccharide-1-P 4'-kinase